MPLRAPLVAGVALAALAAAGAAGAIVPARTGSERTGFAAAGGDARAGESRLAAEPLPDFGERPEECPPPTVSLRGAWRPPTGHEWTSRTELEASTTHRSASRGAKTRDFETLGHIEVASVSRIGTRSALRCRGERCVVCPPEVEGVFGYEFHRILLARDLEGAECHRQAALAHERLHADLYAAAERRFLPRLRAALRARLARLTPVTTDRAGAEEVQARWQAALERVIGDLAEQMDRETDAQQDQLDTEAAYRRWSAETEARCGPFPTRD